jgi:hypothetical protein
LAAGSLLPGAVAFLLGYRAEKDRVEDKEVLDDLRRENSEAMEGLRKENEEALAHFNLQIVNASVGRSNAARLLGILGGEIMQIIYASNPSYNIGVFERGLVQLLWLALKKRPDDSEDIRVIFLKKGQSDYNFVDEKLTPTIFYPGSRTGFKVEGAYVIRQSTPDEISAGEVLAQRGAYKNGLLVEAVDEESPRKNILLLADDGVKSYCRVAVKDPLVEHGILCVDSWVPDFLGAGDREVIGAFAAILSLGLTLGSERKDRASGNSGSSTSGDAGEGVCND